jgi:branched-subunit amino acid transport protein AzlD
MSEYEILITVLVMGAGTVFTRVLPFLLFSGKRQPPPFVAYLGRVLPYAIIGLLVVYSFRNTQLLQYPYGIPELIAMLTVIGLHKWKHSFMLSILGGTAVYMILVQQVFV